MSYQIKYPYGPDKLWCNINEGDYSYDNGIDDHWPDSMTIKMSIHPGWLELMDKLEIGDVVTTHKGDIGVVTKIYDITSLGMKKYEILIGNEREIFFSINLKKMDNEE